MSNLHPTLEAYCISVASISFLDVCSSIVFDDNFTNTFEILYLVEPKKWQKLRPLRLNLKAQLTQVFSTLLTKTAAQ